LFWINDLAGRFDDFNIGWLAAYAGFFVGSAVVGWATYHVLKFFEAREAKRVIEAKGQLKSP